jgi:thiamine biosynthesis lipoprotein
MGTVVSLTVENADAEGVDFEAIEAIFSELDTTYSLYRSDSELSRVANGDLDLVDASEELRDTYALALHWRDSTGGVFTPHRPDGVIDLSGVVKALAMDRAGSELGRFGNRDWCMNVGGDVLVSGRPAANESWVVGIVDPGYRGGLLASPALTGSRRACATSGSAERGDHIWTFGATAPVFVQATVIADDIVSADVLATAIIAGGAASLDRICATHDVDAMTVDHHGNIRMTPHFAELPARGLATERSPSPRGRRPTP